MPDIEAGKTTQATIDHPAAREELAHFDETLRIIAEELCSAEDQVVAEFEKLQSARRSDPDSLPTREIMYARAVRIRNDLTAASKRPYFTRVDFRPRGAAATDIYYIGMHGVAQQDGLQRVVIDWRSPVANLYYSGQIGPMSYTAPDGTIEGELLLKRQFGVEDGALVSIFDTDIASQDKYLQSVLGSMGGNRLRDIVTTIQAEQNFVIRYRHDKPLVVQGAAGSGKTTIALHRIAYLLYAQQDTLRAEQMMILAPNPLFLDYISGVLPDLGVENVVQATFLRFAADALGGALNEVDTRDRLAEMLAASAAERAALTDVLRQKGSLRLLDEISDFMDDYEQRFARRDDIEYGTFKVLSSQEIYDFFMRDSKPFPLHERVREFGKLLRSRLNERAAEIEGYLREVCDRKAARLEAAMPQSPERIARMRRLYDGRDAQIKAAHDGIAPLVRRVIASFPRDDEISLSREFMRQRDDALGRYTLAHTSEHRIESEDVAAVASIALRLRGAKRTSIRHVVVDEAQDLSPAEFALLKRLVGHDSFTIVGDLTQGVHAFRGTADWAELTEGVFGGGAVRHDLVTSYRSTVEIMEIAARVVRAQPVPGQREVQPVLRHGDAPVFARFEDRAEQLRLICEHTTRSLADGYTTVAVLTRDRAEARALCAALPPDIGATLLDPESEKYQGGVTVASATDVKGLEFECVIMADVSAKRFSNSPLEARVLYVCLTRPLHRLYCLYCGEITELLAESV